MKTDEAARLHTLTIPGRLPGLNEYILAERTHRMKAAKMKAECEKLIICCIRHQLRGVRIEAPVRLRYVFTEPDRRRDKDNIAAFAHKVIQDSLVKAGILRNDGWNRVEGFTDDFNIDSENPNIRITIEETKEEQE